MRSHRRKHELERFALIPWCAARMQLKYSIRTIVVAIVSLATLGSGRVNADDMVLVVGAAGEPIYEEMFGDWAAKLSDAATAGGVSTVVIGQDELAAEGDGNDKEQLRQAVEALSVDTSDNETVATAWLFFIGHGTFASGTAKFNLRGPDVSAKELATWIAGSQRPIVVVNCASSSGPFVNQLSGKGRVIVTATRSGDEQEFARFGKYVVDAITSSEGDLDHDDEVSILEAFVKAAAETAAFYRTEDRIATEHALIDDNGDGLGTPADAFVGLEVPKTKVAKDGGPDGETAWQFTLIPATNSAKLTPDQVQRRADIESQLRDLRKTKDAIGKDKYWQQVESLMLRQAKLYAEPEKS